MPVSRRFFLSGATASFGLISSIVWGEGGEKGQGATRRPTLDIGVKGVSVFNEWDRLRTVIVGRGDDSMFPLTPVATMEEVLEKPQTNPYLAPEMEYRLVEQLDGLAALLEAQGIRVFRPTLLSPAEKGYLGHVEVGGGLIFMRDPLLVIGNQVIELSLKPGFTTASTIMNSNTLINKGMMFFDQNKPV